MSSIKLPGLNLVLAATGFTVPIFLPPAILRITPVISSTISLQWAVDEYQFLFSWMPNAYREESDKLLPRWFQTWGKQGTRVLMSSFPWSAGAGIANIWRLRTNSWDWKGAKLWYTLGTILAFGHMAFGPKALGLLAKIRKGEPNGRPTQSLSEWLKMHLIRTMVTDLPAVICFTTALVLA